MATRFEGNAKDGLDGFDEPGKIALLAVGGAYSLAVLKRWCNRGKLTNLHVWHFFWSNTAVLIVGIMEQRHTIAHVSFLIALTLKFVLGLVMWSYLANKKSICLQAATMWDKDFSALRYMFKWWICKLPKVDDVTKIGPFTFTTATEPRVSFGDLARRLKRGAMIKDGVYVTESITINQAQEGTHYVAMR